VRVYVCVFWGGGAGAGGVLARRIDHEQRGQRRHGGMFEYLSPMCVLDNHAFGEIPHYIIQASTTLRRERYM
jgi:hypothetical protein